MTISKRLAHPNANIRHQAKKELAMWEALRREIGQPSSLVNHSRLDAGKNEHQKHIEH